MVPLLALGSAMAQDQEAPIRRVTEISAKHLEPDTKFYSVYITGKKVGWMKDSFSLKQNLKARMRMQPLSSSSNVC